MNKYINKNIPIFCLKFIMKYLPFARENCLTLLYLFVFIIGSDVTSAGAKNVPSLHVNNAFLYKNFPYPMIPKFLSCFFICSIFASFLLEVLSYDKVKSSISGLYHPM